MINKRGYPIYILFNIIYRNKHIKINVFIFRSDPKQADWAKSFIKLLKATQTYVKDDHGTGLKWNPSVSFLIFKGKIVLFLF